MTAGFTESVVEDAALGWLQSLGDAVLHGPDIAAGEPAAERSDQNYRDAILEGYLRQALVRLNPDLAADASEDGYRRLTRIVSASHETLLPKPITGKRRIRQTEKALKAVY